MRNVCRKLIRRFNPFFILVFGVTLLSGCGVQVNVAEAREQEEEPFVPYTSSYSGAESVLFAWLNQFDLETKERLKKR